MRRAAIWAITLPLVAAGMHGAHELGYRLAGVPAGDVHGYLAHAPQTLGVLATLSLLALAAHGRAGAPAPWQFALLAVSGFVVQEHAERLVHAGELPLLLTRPEFLAGLVLQLPVALLVHALARRLLAVEAAAPGLPPPLPALLLPVVSVPVAAAPAATPLRRSGRGPPVRA